MFDMIAMLLLLMPIGVMLIYTLFIMFEMMFDTSYTDKHYSPKPTQPSINNLTKPAVDRIMRNAITNSNITNTIKKYDVTRIE